MENNTSPSESIRKELRAKRQDLQYLKDKILSLEIKLLIEIRKEDKESVNKVNKFEPFSKTVKGVPKKYRQEKETTQRVDRDELKRLLNEVD